MHLAMPIRHATLHEHTQGLLQVPTLEQVISKALEYVFWARLESILRAIPRGIAITDHAAGTPFGPRSYYTQTCGHSSMHSGNFAA